MLQSPNEVVIPVESLNAWQEDNRHTSRAARRTFTFRLTIILFEVLTRSNSLKIETDEIHINDMRLSILQTKRVIATPDSSAEAHVGLSTVYKCMIMIG